MSYNASLPFSLPLLPPDLDLRDPDILEWLVKAHQELGQLKGLLMKVSPNPLLLITPTILQESVASSEIENIHTTVVDVLQGELFPEVERREPEKEVLRYRDAILWGHQNLKKHSLNTPLILGIHQRLLQAKKTEFRKLQNRIKNTLTHEVIYTPPEATSISKLLENWCWYSTTPEKKMDPLVKCAITHYQFEAIHPFEDGNGRTGRILMVLNLIEQNIIPLPVLYVSGFLKNNRSDYYQLLLSVTRNQRWKEYIIFMLQAFYHQAAKTTETLTSLLLLHAEYRERIKEKHRKIYSADLVDHLFSHPLTTPVKLAQAMELHQVTASKYLHELVKGGFLKDRWHGKYHFFINEKLIKLLK